MRPAGHPTARGARGVWGDVKTLQPGQAYTVADLEFDEPRVLLISGYAPGGLYMDWTVRTGIERSFLADDTASVDKFSRVVVCRALQVAVKNNLVGITAQNVALVVVEIDAKADVADIIGTRPRTPQGNPNSASIYRHTLDAASFPLTSSFPGIWAPYYTRGWIVTNYSPNGSKLFVKFDSAAAATNDYSIVLESGQSYTTLYNGPMTAICDVADADPLAFVHVTSLGYSPVLVPV